MTKKRKRRAVAKQEQRVKSVNSSSLAGGGKAPPAKLLSEDDQLPEKGLIVSPVSMAESIIKGTKTMFVKTRPMHELSNKSFVLLSGQMAYGAMALGEMVKMDQETLLSTADQHLVDDSELQRLSKSYSGWRQGPYYAWPIKDVSMYEEPRLTSAQSGPQTIIDKVVVSGCQEDIDKLRGAWGSPAGKTHLAGKIIKKIPSHKIYVEPFAGGAAVFFAKSKSTTEVLADLNGEIAFCFKFLRDASDADLKAVRAKNWVVSRATAEKVHHAEVKTDIDRFYRLVYKRYALFFCNDSRITAIDPSKEGKRAKFIDRFEEIKERLHGTEILNSDYAKVVERYDSKDTFFYFDPPWPDFNQEMGEKSFDVQSFIKQLHGIKGRFMLHIGMNMKGELPLKDKWIQREIPINATGGFTQGKKKSSMLEITNYDFNSVDIHKIDDTKSYDPSGVSDTVLRDDFRIVLAWYATLRQNPEGSKHDLPTLQRLLKAILQEAVKRGPDVITFSPGAMKMSVRDFFNRAAKEVGVPQEQIHKLLDIAKQQDVGKFTTSLLLELHWDLHKHHATANEKEDTDALVNIHALVVDELYERVIKHPSPPDAGIDGFSVDFERHGTRQPEHYKHPRNKRNVIESNDESTEEAQVESREDIYQRAMIEYLEEKYATVDS